MQAFFASGHAVDVVLVVIAVEAAWLIATRRMNVWSTLLVLGPGVFILLGVRAALVGADWSWVSLALLASFPLHLLDLRRRLTNRP
ncbi:hypothetical protein IP78_01460 [Brevundimonas sp. AAP58]|uniref:hypothetical protein n=1 Tax=Brevundimonas sp. AAP58 TaxID=1523422 RepID=UPI0006B987E7|nr:hypothetical protein [Brevundimonas sp. AAP58]KPF83829.1 hypothetical protein IP78_01460 [Brevundimonas sp. AAP58]